MRIAVIEDETLIRAGIRKKLEKMGQQVVFDTDNGYRLLEYLRDETKEQPQVLFADICMPAMDGLELMRQVKEEWPKLEVVILSGYDRFEYVRTALRLGGYDYLLKPICQEELFRVLSVLEKQIKERCLEGKAHDQQEGLENLADHICSRGDIVLTGTTRELLKTAFPEGYYLCLVLLSNWESHLNWFGRETVGEWSFIYPDHPNLLIALVKQVEEHGLKEQLEGIPFTAWYSSPLKDTEQLVHEVRRGIRCIKDHLMLEKQRIFRQGQSTCDEPRVRQWESYYETHYELFVKGLEKHQKQEIRVQIDSILSYPGIAQSRRNQAWLWMAWKICEQYNIHEGVGDTVWLQEYDTLESFVEGAGEALMQLLEEQESSEDPELDKPVLEAIIEYMNRNYAGEITLKGTSEQFYINRSHLARIFKLKTGMTFNTYLTELRISKACELLRQGVTISRVAEMVGYDNSRYFSRVFCKVKGCIPSRYGKEQGVCEK